MYLAMEKALKAFVPKTVSPKVSQTMSRIRGKGNKTTEVKLRMHLVAKAIRGWKMHAPLPGKPDFYFARKKVVVFVDGCFWHGHTKCMKRVKTNKKFWETKIALTKKRDRRINRYWRAHGFKVVRIWECEVSSLLHSFQI